MTEFKSSIGSKRFNNAGNQKTFEIPDESGDVPFPPEEIRNPHAPGYMGNSPEARMAAARASAVNSAAGSGFGSAAGSGQQQNGEEEQAFARARQEKRHGVRISSEAKSRIEFLINLGRMTSDITIENVKFSLRTLKGREMRESLVHTAKADSINQIFEARKQQLARSLYAIDGAEIALIIGTDELGTCMEFIDELEENVISALYKEFVTLNNKSASLFEVKTNADVKEVVEDLKK